MKIYQLCYTESSEFRTITGRTYSTKEEAEKALAFAKSIPEDPCSLEDVCISINEVEVLDKFEPWISVEKLKAMQDEYDSVYDEPDDYGDYDYCPDPMDSAEDAFAYLEEEERCNECGKESYLSGNTIEDMAEIDERHDNDDEIEEYANTPHDDVNVELKQTLVDIKKAQITKAIWAAREHMMSKIVFDNDDAYPIHKIDFDLDDNGIPVDIVISTREKYLDYIAANHSKLGYNLNDEEEHGFKTALYGRLDSFRLYDYKGEPISWDSLPSALYRAVHKVMQSKLRQEVIEDTLLGIANGGITSISGIVQLLMENLEDWDK